MDLSVGKIWLDGSTQSCNGQLNIQQKEVRSGCSSGGGTEMGIFNIFVSDMDSGIESTLSKPAADTKLCGAVEKLEGRDAMQRVPDKLEMGACANLSNFNEAKCKVLYLGQGNPSTSTVGVEKESRLAPGRKTSKCFWTKKLKMSCQGTSAAQKPTLSNLTHSVIV